MARIQLERRKREREREVEGEASIYILQLQNAKPNQLATTDVGHKVVKKLVNYLARGLSSRQPKIGL